MTEPLPNKKYGAIYADPPWNFKVWSKKGEARAPENHYDTMKLKDICELPVQSISAIDCCLFMWAVMPQLPEALKVMDAWGFQYKTCAFSWMKQNKKSAGLFTGLGYWTRANSEICLLGTRGKPKRLNRDVKQAILSPLREHSRKPDEIRGRIERLVSGPYIELFGRTTYPGWDVWGKDTEKFV